MKRKLRMEYAFTSTTHESSWSIGGDVTRDLCRSHATLNFNKKKTKQNNTFEQREATS